MFCSFLGRFMSDSDSPLWTVEGVIAATATTCCDAVSHLFSSLREKSQQKKTTSLRCAHVYMMSVGFRT